MFDQVNWIAVIGAAIVAFAINAVWYGPLFGARWARLIGVDPNVPGGMPLGPILAVNFVMNAVGATA
ncbi:MAG: DUF1761 family protein, partial [Chloroflexi bacterium]|nr:DUF1761 family protein [Chloroflexota bacterium]